MVGCLCLVVVVNLLVCFGCDVFVGLRVNSVGICYPEFIHICCLFGCCLLRFVYACGFFWMVIGAVVCGWCARCVLCVYGLIICDW